MNKKILILVLVIIFLLFSKACLAEQALVINPTGYFFHNYNLQYELGFNSSSILIGIDFADANYMENIIYFSNVNSIGLRVAYRNYLNNSLEGPFFHTEAGVDKLISITGVDQSIEKRDIAYHLNFLLGTKMRISNHSIFTVGIGVNCFHLQPGFYEEILGDFNPFMAFDLGITF